MIYVLGKVNIVDFDRFIEVFSTRGMELRKKHGCRGSRVFKVAGQDGTAMALLEWESEAAFQGFLNDPMVPEAMRYGGALDRPEFTLLEAAAEFDG